MIKSVNYSSVLTNLNKTEVNKQVKKEQLTQDAQRSSDNNSKIDKISKDIANGKYKVDIQGLAEKIAQELI